MTIEDAADGKTAGTIWYLFAMPDDVKPDFCAMLFIKEIECRSEKHRGKLDSRLAFLFYGNNTKCVEIEVFVWYNKSKDKRDAKFAGGGL